LGPGLTLRVTFLQAIRITSFPEQWLKLSKHTQEVWQTNRRLPVQNLLLFT